MKNETIYAFPSDAVEEQYEDGAVNRRAPGMTLRDYFAGQALAGILAESHTINPDGNEGRIAKAVYSMADAMLAEREARS